MSGPRRTCSLALIFLAWVAWPNLVWAAFGPPEEPEPSEQATTEQSDEPLVLELPPVPIEGPSAVSKAELFEAPENPVFGGSADQRHPSILRARDPQLTGPQSPGVSRWSLPGLPAGLSARERVPLFGPHLLVGQVDIDGIGVPAMLVPVRVVPPIAVSSISIRTATVPWRPSDMGLASIGVTTLEPPNRPSLVMSMHNISYGSGSMMAQGLIGTTKRLGEGRLGVLAASAVSTGNPEMSAFMKARLNIKSRSDIEVSLSHWSGTEWPGHGDVAPSTTDTDMDRLFGTWSSCSIDYHEACQPQSISSVRIAGGHQFAEVDNLTFGWYGAYSRSTQNYLSRYTLGGYLQFPMSGRLDLPALFEVGTRMDTTIWGWGSGNSMWRTPAAYAVLCGEIARGLSAMAGVRIEQWSSSRFDEQYWLPSASITWRPNVDRRRGEFGVNAVLDRGAGQDAPLHSGIGMWWRKGPWRRASLMVDTWVSEGDAMSYLGFSVSGKLRSDLRMLHSQTPLDRFVFGVSIWAGIPAVVVAAFSVAYRNDDAGTVVEAVVSPSAATEDGSMFTSFSMEVRQRIFLHEGERGKINGDPLVFTLNTLRASDAFILLAGILWQHQL